MGDEAQAAVSNASRPAAPARRTAAQEVADLRQELDGYQNAINRKIERLASGVTAAQERADGAARELAALSAGGLVGEMEENDFTDRVTNLTNAAMRPVVEKANATMAHLVARVEDFERRLAAVEFEPHSAAALSARVVALEAATPVANVASAERIETLTTRVAGLEQLLADAAQAVEHLPIPSDLVGRLEALEEKAANPPRFALDGEQMGRIIERASAIARSDSGRVDDPFTAIPQVHGRVLELMQKVSQIGKDKRAPTSIGGYAFRGIDQVMDAVGAALRDVGLVLETQILERDYVQNEGRNKEGKPVLWTSCRLVIRYTFIAPEDGSRHSFEMVGESAATDDKATSKAASMALKYGLLQALMVPVEGIPDADQESPEVNREQRPPASDRTVQGPPSNPAPDSAQRQFTEAEQAHRAYEALKQVNRLPGDQQQAELARVINKIQELGLGAFVIDGAPLRTHGVAMLRTMATGRPDPGDGF